MRRIISLSLSFIIFSMILIGCGKVDVENVHLSDREVKLQLKDTYNLSATVSPSNVFTGVSNTSDMEISISASGTDRPCSHLEVVCLTTFN